MFGISEQILTWLAARAQALMSAAPAKGLRVGVLAGSGHGDHYARGFAFGATLHDALPAAHVTVITLATGNMVELDLAHAYKKAGKIDAHIMTQMAPRGAMIRALRPYFQVLYDAMPYAPAAYCSPEVDPVAWVDPNMGGYRIFYDGYPKDNWRLIERPESQWEILSNATRIGDAAMLAGNLLAPTECAPAPAPEECPPFIDPAGLVEAGGKTCWDRCKVHGQRYVVVHNSAGKGGLTKEAPPELFGAIIAHLKELRIKAVQVGGPKDAPIEGGEDRRGYRLPVTCRLIRGSLGVVAIEGFLPYVAAALGVPCVTLFGPTPRPVFAFPQHLNLLEIVDKGNGQTDVPCGMPCFWGGDGVCWSRTWSLRCPRGPRHPAFDPKDLNKRLYCINFPEPQQAAAKAAQFLLALEKVGKA